MKLSNKEMEKLWGDGGPYSQVNLIFENRILDDSEARKYFYIHIELNPLTFEIIEKNIDKFKDDEWVMNIMENANFINEQDGYESYPFRIQFLDKDTRKEAEQALEESKKAIIRMHKFVMNVLGNLEDL